MSSVPQRPSATFVRGSLSITQHLPQRERAWRASTYRSPKRLGGHAETIVSLGTCSANRGSAPHTSAGTSNGAQGNPIVVGRKAVLDMHRADDGPWSKRPPERWRYPSRSTEPASICRRAGRLSCDVITPRTTAAPGSGGRLSKDRGTCGYQGSLGGPYTGWAATRGSANLRDMGNLSRDPGAPAGDAATPADSRACDDPTTESNWGCRRPHSAEHVEARRGEAQDVPALPCAAATQR